MKKKLIVYFAALLASVNLHAQTLNDAIRLTDNEQFEAASSAFRTLIASEPANASYYYYSGENYLLSDNADSALIMYDLGLKADPANLLVQIGHAKHMLDMFGGAESKRNSNIANDDFITVKNNYDKLPSKTPEDEVHVNEMKAKAAEAEAIYQKAIANVKSANILIDETVSKAGPKNVQILIEAADALIHFKNKDLDKAKILLDKAAALQPKNAEIMILFGDIYTVLNNGTLAAEYYNKALDLNPKSVKAIVNKGRLYKQSTNFEGAAEEFKNAIKIDDSFAPAHRELGECYYRLGKLEDAKAEYKRYLELSKNNCGARIRYASFLYLSKDYAGALNEISQLKNSCDANSATLLRVTAYSLYETKDTATSMAAAEKLFEKVSEDKLIGQDYEYFGKIYVLNNMDSLGADMLRKAYLMDKSRCDLLNEIWKANDKMKKYAEASAVMQEKIQNCKGITVTDYFNLGRSYFFSTDYVNADSAFAKVNELSPKYASGFLWRAKTNAFIDSTSKEGLAKPHYEKYMEVAIADSVNSSKYRSGLLEAYHYLASYNYIQLHDRDNALIYLRKIIELDPDDKDTKKAIEGILFEKDPKNKKPVGGK
ncbi:MAG: tetratricopeptide repeat protein [Bacteroidota bacterium]